MNRYIGKNVKIIYIILIAIMLMETFLPIYSYAESMDEVGGMLFKPLANLFIVITDLIYSKTQKIFLGIEAIQFLGSDNMVLLTLLGPSTIFSNKVPALNADFFSDHKEEEGPYELNYSNGSSDERHVIGEPRKSSAYVLKKVISKWYKGLRTVALVFLLSVLVYVGIRIIISATGQEKAKYKKMIIDWFAAICILFTLHYIMAFIVYVTNQLTTVFSNTLTPDGQDLFVTEIRASIAQKEFSQIFARVLTYVTLIILTITFALHYLKRLIYLAFLTMIAPLIALTYPIDKIKDGQAQAFTLWVREYTFNSLIPVIHLLIYTIFTDLAEDLISKNPLYAIIAIAFMVPAEKFIRQMFGFDKASTVSQLGAAAGGALLMNGINKLGAGGGGGSPKGGQQGEESGSSNVRTKSSGYIPSPSERGSGAAPTLTSNTQGQAPQGTGDAGGQAPQGTEDAGGQAPQGTGDSGGQAPQGTGDSGGQTPQGTGDSGGQAPQGTGDAGGQAPQGNEPQQEREQENGQNSNIVFGENIEKSKKADRSGSRKAGFTGLKDQYINRPTIVRAVTKSGRWVLRKAFGVIGATALGTIGLAAGVASGDLGKAVKYAGAGLAAGYAGAYKLADKLEDNSITRGVKNATQTYKENKWGTAEYETRITIKEMENNPEFLKVAKGLDAEERENLIRTYIANGITDQDKIVSIMSVQQRINSMSARERKKRGFGERKISHTEIIAAQKLSQKMTNSYWGQPQSRIRFKQDLIRLGIEDDDVKRAEALVTELKGDLSY